MEVNVKLLTEDDEFLLKNKMICSNKRTLRTKNFRIVTDIMKKASTCFHEL